MKILLVITGLGIGGAETQICNLADEFVRLGHQVQILCLTGKVLKYPLRKEVRIINLNMNKNILNIMEAYKKVQNVINEFEPDVVHSHLFHANILMRLIRVTCKFPVLICTAHNIIESSLFRILTYRLTNSFCEIFTNVSLKAVESFEKKGVIEKNKIIVQHNGIDTNYFKFNYESRNRIRRELKISDNTQILLSVGRLSEEKDYPNLLRAFSQLKQDNIKLLIVGIGDKECELKILSQNLNLKNNVVFLGLRNDIPELMSACDIFILSSKSEGFGLVLAEAMSCERVVIATDTGGTSEVVGECGYLVKACSHNDLALAIEKILTKTNEEKQKMGLKARNRVIEKFSIQTIAKSWLNNIYTSILKK